MHSRILLSILTGLATSNALHLRGNVPKATAAELACQTIVAKLPGVVFYPGNPEFDTQIFHDSASSTQTPTCVVEPSTVEDVSFLLKTIAACRVPFAIKNGGHTAVQGRSSTTGVQISINKFRKLELNRVDGTLIVGAGLIWTDVNAFLDGTGLGVLGGRANGPGVSGLSLGGGWPWQAQEHGLVVDQIVQVTMVAPNGTALTVSATSHPDLFWAIKGGGNQFGIVTEWKFKTFAQGPIYAGAVLIGADGNRSLINLATQTLAQWDKTNKDPKAVVTSFVVFGTTSPPLVNFQVFYNGPTPPAGTFKLIDDLPGKIGDTRAEKSFATFINDTLLPHNPRTTFGALGIGRLGAGFVQEAVNSAYDLMDKALGEGKSFAGAAVIFEPFMSVFQQFSQGGAYPHGPGRGAAPFGFQIAYTDAADDGYFQNEMNKAHARQLKAGVADGSTGPTFPILPNYGGYGQTGEVFYQENLGRLKAIKKANDPTGIMGLTGGIKL